MNGKSYFLFDDECTVQYRVKEWKTKIFQISIICFCGNKVNDKWLVI